jgi:enoyl-CoA hydratase
MVLCADIIVAGRRVRLPPAASGDTDDGDVGVSHGTRAGKRYMLTGDEIPAPKAAEFGLILEAVPDDRLQEHALALAKRMAQVPANQLIMLKLLCNQTAENMGLASSRTLGTLFDGIARHTQEGLDFVTRSKEVGFREAVRERDNRFGDYGSRPKQ